MEHFFALAGFEYKKLMQRKTVWITMIVLSAVVLLAVCIPVLSSSYSIAGEEVSRYELIQRNRADEKLLEGRPVDETLFREVQSDSDSVPEGIFSMMYSVMGLEIYSLDKHMITADEFYEKREVVIQNSWVENRLTKGEIEYLREQEEKVEIPFSYQYAGGYRNMKTTLYTIVILQILLCAICIPGIFSEEHVRKTDQLILSSPFGKKVSYAVKVMVGSTFALLGTVIMIIVAAVSTFLIYGMEGSHAQMQVLLPETSGSLRAGEMVMILTGICLGSALLHSIAAMLLSELLKGSVPTMAILVGSMMLALFLEIPGRYRVLAQIWGSTPMRMIMEEAFGPRLVPMFGTYLAAWQCVPVFYLLIAAVMALVGKRLYCNYQVGAR